jgi:hypothetical protein
MYRIVLPTLLIAATACVTPRSYASVVHRDEKGGVLALKGPDRALAEQDARRVMLSQCGEGYEIVAEDRVRTGERTTSSTMGDSGAMMGFDEPFPGYPPGYEPGYPPGYVPGFGGYPYGYSPEMGVGGTQTETKTTPVYEYRITYRCGPAGQAPGR